MKGAFNVLYCGVGGQGVVLMANIIGRACASEGIKVISGELHGLSQRSGSVHVHQRMGDDVRSPLIPYGECDVVLALEPIEALRYAYFLKRGGTVVTSTVVIHPPAETSMIVRGEKERYMEYEDVSSALVSSGMIVYGIDPLSIAMEAGEPQAENVVMVGALCALEGSPVSKKAVFSAVADSVPAKTKEVNLRAFDMGYLELSKRLRKL
ncbi:MAG: indolepyruvate oxidoreductase subunit beta [Candidatus Thermoplasmatota archaeon]|nr:indolepyruvate oxidoreductase subunit beta [Candidatus Thermoplasmatota archaeon]